MKQIHGRNKTKTINTWAVFLMRCGGGIIKSNQEDLKERGVKTKSAVKEW